MKQTVYVRSDDGKWKPTDYQWLCFSQDGECMVNINGTEMPAITWAELDLETRLPENVKAIVCKAGESISGDNDWIIKSAFCLPGICATKS